MLADTRNLRIFDFDQIQKFKGDYKMGINFSRERKKFSEAQQKLRKEYEAAGMTQEQILEMYEYDLHQFNRDIAFYRHTQSLVDETNSDFEEEGRNTLLLKNLDALTVEQKHSESEKYWWLDEIETSKLIQNLKQLSDEELDLIHKLAFCDYTQKQISEETGKSPAAICLKLKTIRKKLKKSE